MFVTGKIAEVRAARWANPTPTWGFVPTMGYLHEGHMSLVRRASAENDRVIVSIYVNPTQFAPTEDLSSYPTDLNHDMTLLQRENVHVLFTPSDEIMYPVGFQTEVQVTDLTRPLEGASRPEHFRGVTTIVTKLLNIVQPTRAYFGQKDAQQAAVIRRMVRDLNINTDIRVCPIVREVDGLALSSRNSYLAQHERRAATILYRALLSAEQTLLHGERNANDLRRLLRKTLRSQPLARIDYVSVADPHTLEELIDIEEGALISLAVFFGRTRLIDNILWLNPDRSRG